MIELSDEISPLNSTTIYPKYDHTLYSVLITKIKILLSNIPLPWAILFFLFLLCRVPQEFGKAHKILGKGFAECNTRQTAHDIYSIGKQLFAECFLSRTQQMICRVSNWTLGKKSGLPSVFLKYTRQRITVCRVFLGITLGKPNFQRKNIFFSAYHYCLPSVFGNYTRQTYFPKKKIIFFSAYHYCLPSVFGNYTRQTYFPKKKIIFFSAYFSLIATTIVSWENIQVSELAER